MNEKDKHDAIQLLGSGQPQEKVADAIGVSQSTISRLAKKNQEAITKEAERVLESLPDITAQLKRDIATSNELSKQMAETLPSLSSVRSKIIEFERDALLDGKKQEEWVKDPVYIKLKASEKLNEEKFYSGFSLVFRDEPKILAKFMELSYKKQADVLRAVGILPATNQSVFIQNLIQNNTTAVINPVVMQVLGNHIRKALEETDIVDVTPIEGIVEK